MSLQTRLAALITAVGADIKALQARTAGHFGDGSDGAYIAATTPINVLANPGAEVDTAGWGGFFTGGGVNAGPTRVSDSGAGSGSFAFELSATGATGAGVLLMFPTLLSSFVGSLTNVVPGQTVEFSANLKAQVGTFTSVRVLARWLDSSGNLLAGGEVDVTGAIQNAPVVGTWYTPSGSLIAPAGAAYAGIEVIGAFPSAGTYTMRVDNLAARPVMLGTTRSGATYTLTRDVYLTDLTVNTGVTIVTAGYRIFCTGTLGGAGTISNDGKNAVGTVAGSITGVGSVQTGWAGGAGATGAANGSGPLANAGTGHGGSGGGGGAGSNGFTAGGLTAPTVPAGGVQRVLPALLNGIVLKVTTLDILGGGGGGGGGGGSSTGGATGGGGGGGGGLLIVAVRILSGSLAFSAKGGSGAAATNNGGGGGGGGGGAIHLIYGDKSGWTGTTDVSAGAGGAKNGTGTNGSAGAAGNVIQLLAAA